MSKHQMVVSVAGLVATVEWKNKKLFHYDVIQVVDDDDRVVGRWPTSKAEYEALDEVLAERLQEEEEDREWDGADWAYQTMKDNR
jgi:hypothetical protein